jgi:hypothetical protein
MTQTLKNNVPSALRKPLENPEIIIPTFVSINYNGDFSEAIEFIGGALDHQKKLASVDEAGKSEAPSFIVVIDGVEIIERKANGKLFGKKAKIHFTDPRDSTKQEMDTGWVEYHGTEASEFAAWQTSLANTIVRVAEDNVGKECVMTKAYVKGVKTKHSSSGKVKFVADLSPKNAADAPKVGSSSSDERPAASSQSSKEESDGTTVSDFRDALDAVKGASDDQIDAALDEKPLIKDVVDALNGKKPIDGVFDLLLEVRGDALTQEIEDTYFDEAESGKLLKAAAKLFATTAK